MTRVLAKQNYRPYLSTLNQLRQFSSYASEKTSAFRRTRRILKWVLICSGVVFWCFAGGLAFVLVRAHLRLGFPKSTTGGTTGSTSLVDPMTAAIFQLDNKEVDRQVTEEGKHQTMKAIAEEVQQKQHAMMRLWWKLKSEEAFLRKFGKNVTITGTKVQCDIPNDDNNNNKSKVETNKGQDLLTESKDSSNVHESSRDKWRVTRYIDGTESSGLVTVEFYRRKVNNNSFWVPVSLLVETVPSSGVKVCEISAPLPNGLTRFSRLFGDEE